MSPERRGFTRNIPPPPAVEQRSLDRLRAQISLPEPAWEVLAAYAEMLVRRARPAGLVGFPPEMVTTEIARSLLLLEVLPATGRLIDLGSGAGLPGIPLAIARPGEPAVLVEARRRAVAFLEYAIRTLEVSAEVVPAAAEVAAAGALRESATAVVCRAVAPPPVAAELCAPLCAVGGWVVLTAAPEEPGTLPAEMADLGLADFRDLVLSGCFDIRQRVIVMEKVSPTPPRFPRRAGTARRRPLG